VTDGFVSYSRRDREAVLPVVRAAEALDRSLRFDGDDIPAATLWRDELAEAIAASDTFVCFLSVTDAHAVDWAPGGAEIVTGDSDGYVRLWSADTGGPVGERIPTEHYVMAVAYSPDGSMPAAGDLFGVRAWESLSERDACRFAPNALGAEGLRAIAGPSAPALRCATRTRSPPSRRCPWCRSARGDGADRQ
jgi:hypothetical protein